MGIFFEDLSTKRECTTCKHHSILMGCSKSVPLPKQNAITCSYFENVYKYKEQLKKERKAKEERERLEQENDRLKQENDQLRVDNLFKTSKTSTTSTINSSSFNSTYEPDYEETGIDFSDDVDDNLSTEERIKQLDSQLKELEKLENDIVNIYAPAVKEAEKNFVKVIKQIKELRNESFDSNIIEIDGLDDFMLSIKDIKEQLGEPDDDDSKMDKLIIGFNKKAESFGLQFEEEINWNFKNDRFNVAYALAESYLKSELRDFSRKVKQYRIKYITFNIEKAKKLMNEEKYNDALEFLNPIKEEKVASELITKCHAEKEEKSIKKAIALYESKRNDDAIQLLKTCNSERAKQLIRKISSNSKKKTMTAIGLILLIVGIGFMILGITSVAKVNAAMSPDVPFDEFSRIQDTYSPLETMGFLFGIPAIIAGLVLSIIGLKRYKVK